METETAVIRTGIFGGSFNPIHIGHLALANYLCETDEVDEIWFLVSPQNPLKQATDLLDDHWRLRLVQAAIEGYPHFRASDFEFALPRPSYMARTLQLLSEAYPAREFTLIIGADNWEAFSRWKSPEEIIRDFRILIYPRAGHPVKENVPLPPHVRLTHTPILEISSTFIREAFVAGKDPRYFLHPAVYELIRSNQLYATK